MTCALFLKRNHSDGPAPRQRAADMLEKMHPALSRLGGLHRATLCISGSLTDPLVNEAAHACSCLVLYFDEQHHLTLACANSAHLSALLQAEPFKGWLPGELSYQAMQTHYFATGGETTAATVAGYGYLVGYEGNPSDATAWAAEYMKNHVALMQRLPGIRQIEVFTRLSQCAFQDMGIEQNWMLRNLVSFDTRDAMDAALRSPARAALRAHRAGMEHHGGSSEHVSMSIQSIKVNGPAPDT